MSANSKTKTDSDSKTKDTEPAVSKLKTIDLGVYTIALEVPLESWNIRNNFQQIRNILPLFRRLAHEIYALEPVLSILYVISQLWSGVEAAILLYLSSRLLKIIEIGLIVGKPDKTAIFSAVVARAMCIMLTSAIAWGCNHILPVLRSRITTHFEIYLMRANLRVDVPTSQEPRSTIRASSSDAWYAFEGVINFLVQVTRMVSQILLILQASRATGSPLFALFCIARPVYLTLGKQSLWYLPHISFISNEHKKRMSALNWMTSTSYRAEVIGGNLLGYIVSEYEKAASFLGQVSDEWPENQYMRELTPLRDIISNLLGDLPIVYCAAQAILEPTRFSISQVAILQQASSRLEWALSSVVYNVQTFRRQCQELKAVYDAEDIKNTLSDGEVEYPHQPEKSCRGMSFELRNLTFKYPGSQATKLSLDNISLKINAGDLVVIVGANGSGKSTILKLLSRTYDPTSGPSSLFVDGIPISQYRMSDLHKATATLTQEHHIFPLSLGENIGLGNVEHVKDEDMIRQSAEMGGATACIENLEKKYDTVLYTQSNAYGHQMPEEKEHPLNVKLEKLEKNVELSGGETQRVVASRTFMRFRTENVKYVAVDEPSSALDPEGEVQLFDNLIKAREGKTLIFVTHRFGHLTKHADLIVCMKDGKIAESGTHESLMAMNAEYAKLYNIQASAFVADLIPT